MMWHLLLEMGLIFLISLFVVAICLVLWMLGAFTREIFRDFMRWACNRRERRKAALIDLTVARMASASCSGAVITRCKIYNNVSSGIRITAPEIVNILPAREQKEEQ